MQEVAELLAAAAEQAVAVLEGLLVYLVQLIPVEVEGEVNLIPMVQQVVVV
jgi:hypothetical protein